MKYCIYTNARQSFFHTLMHVKCQTGPCRAKPRLASPNMTKRENRARLKLLDTIFFLLCPLSKFLKNTRLIETQLAVFRSSSKEAPMLVICFDGVILFHWAPYKQ